MKYEELALCWQPVHPATGRFQCVHIPKLNTISKPLSLCSYLAAVGPRCRAWRACSRPSSSSEPRLWQRSSLRPLFWCPFSGSWSGGRTAQRIQWAERQCWCWDCTRPPGSEAGKDTVQAGVTIISVLKAAGNFMALCPTEFYTINNLIIRPETSVVTKKNCRWAEFKPKSFK